METNANEIIANEIIEETVDAIGIDPKLIGASVGVAGVLALVGVGIAKRKKIARKFSKLGHRVSGYVNADEMKNDGELVEAELIDAKTVK